MLGYIIAALAGSLLTGGLICVLIGGAKDTEKVTRCKDCAARWNCQIRLQCMEDEDFCSLGIEEE